MEALETLRVILGWSSVMGVGMLMFSFLAVTVFRSPVVAIHKSMFKVNEEDLNLIYFQYLALFKLLVIVFALIPYFAICIAT